MGDMSREPSMEDILSSIRRVIARDEETVQARIARVVQAPGAPDHRDMLELNEENEDQSAGHAADQTAADEPGEDAGPQDPLVSHSSLDAARQSLEALNSALASGPHNPAASRTIDDLVMEALRPVLKQWLDHNLPPIVEAIVAKEIARITGRGG